MLLVTKGMWFSGTEHPAWACPFVQPDGHTLVKSQCPPGNKCSSHILVPFFDHLPDLPKRILVRRSFCGHVTESLGNLIEPPTTHEIIQTEFCTRLLAWICLAPKFSSCHVGGGGSCYN